ncbi:unnamed protein product [Didymodactylos carnosus]|uniref:Uncharacterized protein n=1 Tax=Didymodactylos carnosus TaxID=1234261 RepID=A0A8S2GUY7_9BILA|nr:unnamed protein product [Didymodactylos carnosus]CAF3564033.1 unnamed protein product [Didymodactylos carnosus]
MSSTLALHKKSNLCHLKSPEVIFFPQQLMHHENDKLFYIPTISSTVSTHNSRSYADIDDDPIAPTPSHSSMFLSYFKRCFCHREHIPYQEISQQDEIEIENNDELRRRLHKVISGYQTIERLQDEQTIDIISDYKTDTVDDIWDEDVRNEFSRSQRGGQYRRNGTCNEIDQDLNQFTNVVIDIIIEDNLRAAGVD